MPLGSTGHCEPLGSQWPGQNGLYYRETGVLLAESKHNVLAQWMQRLGAGS